MLLYLCLRVPSVRLESHEVIVYKLQYILYYFSVIRQLYVVSAHVGLPQYQDCICALVHCLCYIGINSHVLYVALENVT